MTGSGSDEVVIWQVATERLGGDSVFGGIVERVGPVRVPRLIDPPFVYLVRAIVYQQLAGAAARTIHGRVIDALAGEVTPSNVLATDGALLRGAGLSSNKLKAITDLARRADSGDISLEVAELAKLDDAEVIERLTRVWGIGVWTVQMFLMFRLHRPDVWPVLDLGVRNGWARVHDLDEAPPARELEELGDPYTPWRSAAAWYCWRALEIED